MAEYIVTVKKDANWKELHDELSRDTSADSSVDSNIVPDREVITVKEKPDNKRNTHYELSTEEAEKLKADNRILKVENVADIKPMVPSLVQEGNFNKYTNTYGSQDNWGLLRHISKTNNFSNLFDDPGGSYDYVLDGTGVDVVIMDTGIQVGHPEWEDKNGTTRLKQINWYTAAGRSDPHNSTFWTNHYKDSHGHGTHVAGTVAGKTFGWAKNADIYSMAINGTDGANISSSDMYDLVREWHNKKNNPGDASYTGRPTVVNMSFGQVIYYDAGNDSLYFPNAFNYSITGGVYRGTSHSATGKLDLKDRGFTNLNPTNTTGSGYMVPYRTASVDADVTQMIDAGIHICIAAGNEALKIDAYGGPDWNNYLQAGGYDYYYNRGSSPSGYETGDIAPFSGTSAPGQDTTPAATFMVGAMARQPKSSTVEGKADFSNSGPGVDIYAAGEEIQSSISNSNGVSYFGGGGYKQDRLQGTSMASPQIAGMAACLVQAHPDWTPKQVKDYFLYHSQSTMHDSGNNADWDDTNTIHGGNNRTAYFPMHGKKPFSFG